jgi:hypothetical protein
MKKDELRVEVYATRALMGPAAAAQVAERINQLLENQPFVNIVFAAAMAARFLYCIVPGTSKATAVFNTLNKEIKEEYPAAIIRTHPHAVLFLDKASAPPQ